MLGDEVSFFQINLHIILFTSIWKNHKYKKLHLVCLAYAVHHLNITVQYKFFDIYIAQ